MIETAIVLTIRFDQGRQGRNRQRAGSNINPTHGEWL